MRLQLNPTPKRQFSGMKRFIEVEEDATDAHRVGVAPLAGLVSAADVVLKLIEYLFPANPPVACMLRVTKSVYSQLRERC